MSGISDGTQPNPYRAPIIFAAAYTKFLSQLLKIEPWLLQNLKIWDKYCAYMILE